MKTPLHFFISFLSISLLLILSTNSFAQTAPIQYYIQSYQLESGTFDGSGNLGSNPVNVYTEVIELHNIPWLQLHFSEVNLGRESYIILTSLYDGRWQKLNSVSLKQWQAYSAFFNGSAVEIRLFVAPIDRGVFIKLDEITVGEWELGDPGFSICGPTDDRMPSNQPATSRLLNIGCTAWIIPNGKFVSAGHCLDGSGANIVEFNVPPSLPNGTIQHPGPEDQYSVDVTTKIYTDGGIGNDWGVFEVFPNSITGLMPKEAQNAFWPLVQDLGPDSIRITGYGVDNGTANQTQQTHIGPNAGSSGTTMRYVTDTQGGNSGSPVIDGLTNDAVGVHTHGGCTSSGGNNNGTSTFHAAFWAAVDEGAGGCPVELPTNPTPANGQTDIPLNLAELSWSNGAGALTNELYFGTNPSSLSLVQSGSLATSWTITGVTFTYGTTYYWRVIEIGDSCSSNGPVWNFTTVQDPNLFIAFNETFNNLTCWTPIGPLGTTNWSVQTSNNAGGSPPSELQLSWTPSFNGLSKLLSCTINSSTLQVNTVSLKHLCDWFADPAPFMGIGVTYDAGATYTSLWEFQPVGGNVGPEDIFVNFTPAQNDFQLVLYHNGNSFNIDFWYVDDIMVTYIVPVELTSFTAKNIKDGIELNWRTATETNNQGFEVERMDANGTFEKIGFIAGFGTTTEPKNYSFIDSKLTAGLYSYRLKQIDFDGTFAYSEEVNIEVEIPLDYSLEQNYPNPFNPSTRIKFSIPAETDVRLNVYNTLGQQVAEIFNGRLKEGYHELEFNAESLTSGIYFYRLEADKFVDVKKMIIIK
ncbi:MAG: T9SS type A sorting domain-containing protein [Ignavibacteriaceae bacterium]